MAYTTRSEDFIKSKSSRLAQPETVPSDSAINDSTSLINKQPGASVILKQGNPLSLSRVVNFDALRKEAKLCENYNFTSLSSIQNDLPDGHCIQAKSPAVSAYDYPEAINTTPKEEGLAVVKSKLSIISLLFPTKRKVSASNDSANTKSAGKANTFLDLFRDSRLIGSSKRKCSNISCADSKNTNIGENNDCLAVGNQDGVFKSSSAIIIPSNENSNQPLSSSVPSRFTVTVVPEAALGVFPPITTSKAIHSSEQTAHKSTKRELSSSQFNGNSSNNKNCTPTVITHPSFDVQKDRPENSMRCNDCHCLSPDDEVSREDTNRLVEHVCDFFVKENNISRSNDFSEKKIIEPTRERTSSHLKLTSEEKLKENESVSVDCNSSLETDLDEYSQNKSWVAGDLAELLRLSLPDNPNTTNNISHDNKACTTSGDETEDFVSDSQTWNSQRRPSPRLKLRLKSNSMRLSGVSTYSTGSDSFIERSIGHRGESDAGLTSEEDLRASGRRSPTSPESLYTPNSSRGHTPSRRSSLEPRSIRTLSFQGKSLPFFSTSITSNEDDDDNDTQERGLQIPEPPVFGPSAFIPEDDVPTARSITHQVPSNSNNEQTHMLYVDAFLQTNRLDHVTQVMGYHPTYLDVFLRTQHFILRGDGPLPYDHRHFIAIMAAGRHQCSYLINMQKQDFLLQGGNKDWLEGLHKIPQKLHDLYEINKILAHRPWLINKSHIEKLCKGRGKDNWSLAEVVHAIVLLAHFHCLSSFVFGCGVNEELDSVVGPEDGIISSIPLSGILSSSPLPVPPAEAIRTETWCAGLPAVSPVEPEVGVETLMQRMKTLSERPEETSQEEKTKRFEHIESQSVELSPGSSDAIGQVKADISHFVEDPTYTYQDFARRGETSDIPTFRVQDYSWDDHGYSLVNRLYNDVGNLLDEKFKTAYNLTYYTMGGRRDVDTSRFRRAIWNYIQCMFGIRHDDYDYGEVNQLLERSLKSFIKSACCYPERVTKKDYDRVLREFRHSEKVHVNLMILEARMQAELLYALRAVMCYTMT